MEIVDIYNKDRVLTGKTILRGNMLTKEEYLLVVHLCIFNSSGEMLIQQRQPFKSGWPNMWDITVGGCAVTGDTSVKAIEREVFEELGYKLNLTNTRPSLTINFETGFDDIYLIEDDVDINNLSLQYDEVQQVKWAKKSEIIQMINNEEFIPYYQSFIELLFDMRKYRGTYRRSTQSNG